MHCRFCGKKGIHSILDLGHQPFSNSFLTKEQLSEPEVYYPLELVVCDSCWLVQIKKAPKASEIFKDDYIYHSSQSPANVSHAKEYVDMITKRFNIKSVVEIGSNDGYMLQHFKEKGINVLGIDPATECANEAIQKGIPTLIDFFSRSLARRTVRADLICGINVLAHQPDINDFVSGLKYALNPGGIVTFEFPHLKKMIDGLQFDTVYHEHYYYFSLMTIMEIFERHLLEVFDVDEIPEHGGSLRIYARHKIEGLYSDKVARVLFDEYRMRSLNYYVDFQQRVNKVYYDFINHAYTSNLIAYGAAAKANTFIN
jgi:SAM-dependent methyltransferase